MYRTAFDERVGPALAIPVGVSFVVHAVAILAVALLRGAGERRPAPVRVVQVSLIQPKAMGAAAGRAEVAPVTEKTPLEPSTPARVPSPKPDPKTNSSKAKPSQVAIPAPPHAKPNSTSPRKKVDAPSVRNGKPGRSDEPGVARGNDARKLGEGGHEGAPTGSTSGALVVAEEADLEAQYGAAIASALHEVFRVDGLEEEALDALAAEVHLEIDESGVVVRSRLQPTGNRVFDEALRRAIALARIGAPDHRLRDRMRRGWDFTFHGR